MRRKYRKSIMILTVIMCGIIAVIVYFRNFAVKSFVTIVNSELNSYALNLVNDSIMSSLETETALYKNLYLIKRDTTSNKIVSIETDAYSINLLTRKLNGGLQNEINGTDMESVNVPLGTLVGFKVMYAAGPMVKVKISPINSSECKIVSTFTECGINQTRHSVYASFNIKLTAAIPSYKTVVDVESKVLLYDIIILGEVPEIYLSR